MAGRNITISKTINSSLPNMSEVMDNWEENIIANYVSQQVIDGIISDVASTKTIKGIKQPLKPEEIALKDEGQRSWNWVQIHVREAEYGELFAQQILIIAGVQHKIMAKKDWVSNGYREYHAIRDFESV